VIDAVLLPPDDVPETNTIADIVTTDPNFSTLASAVGAAGLGTTLAGTGPYTVFAPTNAAFDALPEGALEALLADTEALTDVLLYHAIPGAKVNAATVVTLPRATAANQVAIKITVTNGEVFLNDTVKVSATDIEADNGIIHVIDAVLLPPKTIAGQLDSPQFTLLKTAVTAAELTATLDGEDKYTVFAPTNAALQAVGTVEQLQALLANKPKLTDILLHHVVAGTKYASDVVAASSLEMANGLMLPITTEGGAKIGGVAITQTDIYARNGVIHIIDAVLMPPPTITEVVATNPDFSTLLAAVSAAELAATLNGPGPFTVFAPTNAAFAKIPSADLTALLADKPALTDVLLFHVLDGTNLAAQVTAATHFTMKNGALAPIVVGSSATIAGSTITSTDIKVRNGVIHIIDTVMMPAPTIAEIVTDNADFSTLLAAVGAAELATTLDEDGPFTVFAPNNAAFAKVPSADLTALLANKAGLTDVLLYHVYNGVVPASVAVTLTTATMANGDALPISYNMQTEVLTVGGAKVTGVDIWARNGVIHVIDTVLFPQ
jgi:transforming growth factor-beta-induced protein